MMPELALILACGLAAWALVAGGQPRARASAMLGALALAPVILVWHVQDNPAFDALRDRPALLAGVCVAGALAVGGLALLFHRLPYAFPLAAVATVPFRIPIESGGTTSNLLLPLYLVVGAGVLAYAVPRVLARDSEALLDEEQPPGLLEWLLAATVALYGLQAAYSDDFDKALEAGVFFLVPFALLYVLLGRVRWTGWLVARALAVLAGLAVVLAGIGFGEYATRHLLLNPKVITSNQFESFFRVNSLFFDPNIYGRFLALVMLGLAGWLLWAGRSRDRGIAVGVLAVLWAGLVLTFSQSSFAALLLGLGVLGGLRWSVRWASVGAVAVVAAGALFVFAAPNAINLDLGDSSSADRATSGRYDLIKGGAELASTRPLQGYGSASFSRVYRREEKVSTQRATSASHTIPVTVWVEQGVVGLALYLALLAAAFWRLLRGASSSAARAILAAMLTALVAHTWMYAAFLEDPLAWAILAVGSALAVAPAPGPARGANVRPSTP